MASFTWDLHPVPTVDPKIYRKEPSLQTPTIRLEYLTLKVAFMEIKFLFSKQNTVSEFQFLDNSNAPLHYSFKHLIESIQYFNLLSDKKNVIPAVL